MKAGDVVFGPFLGEDRAIRHYSVVAAVEVKKGVEYAYLVYTSSKMEGAASLYGGEFSSIDRKLAGWDKPCCFNAARACVVEANRLKKTGELPKSTLTVIEGKLKIAISRKVASLRTETN